MNEIISELRAEYQLPPYLSDAAITAYVREGEAALRQLVPSADKDGDPVYRGLLKSYAYYAYMHAQHDYWSNYQATILTWQTESYRDITDDEEDTL